MAKRRQAAERDPKPTEDAFPSSPTRPPRYTLYLTNQEEGFLYTPNFARCFAAKKAVDYILDKNTRWEWVSKDTIRCFDEEDGWLNIKSEELEEIVEYDYLEAEAEWELPSPLPRELDRALRIKYDPRVSEESQRDGRRSTQVSSKQSDDRGANKARGRSKTSAGGSVSLADIAEELGLDPRKARATLRGKMDKPEQGWQWPAEEVGDIKKLLK